MYTPLFPHLSISFNPAQASKPAEHSLSPLSRSWLYLALTCPATAMPLPCHCSATALSPAAAAASLELLVHLCQSIAGHN